MLTKFEVRPNTGSPLELNDLNYPLDVLDIEPNIDPKAFKKLAAPGEWPSFTYEGAMTIHAEGSILGSGGTPSNDYVAKRIALIDAVAPPVGVLTSRKHGVIRIRLDGMTEDADVDVVVVQRAIPLRALYPANSEFLITWKAYLPYFVGVSTQTIYQLG